VRFTVDGKPVLARACWCRDCQYLSSGNASVNVIVAGDGLKVSGSTGEYVSRADSGNSVRRRFCLACGTPLFSEVVGEPAYVAVRVGALDDREIGRPASVIWAASAPGWACFDPAVPRHEKHVVAVPKLEDLAGMARGVTARDYRDRNERT